jgi:hypothetical protein
MPGQGRGILEHITSVVLDPGFLVAGPVPYCEGEPWGKLPPSDLPTWTVHFPSLTSLLCMLIILSGNSISLTTILADLVLVDLCTSAVPGPDGPDTCGCAGVCFQ